MGSIGSVTFPLSLTPLRPDLRSYPELSWWFSCAKSRLTLCFPMDCSLPGSSVQRTSQARILEWVAISFSRGSSWPRNWTQVSCIAGRFFTDWTTREARVLTPSIISLILMLSSVLKTRSPSWIPVLYLGWAPKFLSPFKFSFVFLSWLCNWCFHVYRKGTQPYIYMYLFSLKTPLPSRLPHNIEPSSICCTVGPCWLSILNTAVCKCWRQTP